MIAFLVFGLLALSVICLWLLIEGRKSPRFLAWFIPILLVLVSSTYVTYTSILGLPKVATPESGFYLKHYIDEPNWIYLWVVQKGNVPKGFQLVYSKETHKSLEGVKKKSEGGSYMVLRQMDANRAKGEGVEGQEGSGYTIGGDMNFYEWDHETMMPSKD